MSIAADNKGTRFGAAGSEEHPDGTVEARTEPGLVVFRFGVGLFFANSTRFNDHVLALVDGPEPPRWFVLMADAIDDVDFTGGKTLLELSGQLAERNVVLCVATAQSLMPELERFGVLDAIGAEHVFESLDDAIAAFHAAQPSPDGQ